MKEDGLDASKGWHNRGYLPHFDATLWQSMTFCLFDSVPKERIESWREELRYESDAVRASQLRRRIEKYGDAGYGCCWLRNKERAQFVQDQLLFHDDERYKLHSWVVMPNHVHALIRVYEGYSLSRIVQSWKARTARKINEHLRREGQVWERDYFDRFVRDDEHFWRVVEYIEMNPVRAGLVAERSDWLFSSVGVRSL